MSAEIISIAFQSKARLQNLDPDDSFLQDVLIPAFERYFRHPRDPVRVWAEFYQDEGHPQADVFMELMTPDWVCHQFWLMTLTCNPTKGVPFPFCEEPFPEQGFYIPDKPETPESVIQALEEWSSLYWPDWNPDFVWEKVRGLEGLFQMTLADVNTEGFEMYLLHEPQGREGEIIMWLDSHDAQVVCATEEGILAGMREETLEDLRMSFIGLTSNKIQD